MSRGIIAIVMFASVWLEPTMAIEPIKVEYLWQSSPALDFQWGIQPTVTNIHVLPAHITSARASERMTAAQSILRVPDSPTLKRQPALDAILERLTTKEPELLIQADLVAAACELDDGENAATLWQLAQSSDMLRPIVEKACIRWKANQPLTLWRKRLEISTATEHELQLALEGIAATGTQEDVAMLVAIVTDAKRAFSVRLAAGKAIGKVSQQEQLTLARQLVNSRALYPELLAISVLGNTPGDEASVFVQGVANGQVSVAQRAAYEWLCQKDAKTAQKLAVQFLSHADASIRMLAIDQIAAADNDQTLDRLYAALADAHPKLREQARERLLQCCDRSAEHLSGIRARLRKAFQQDDWRSLEQCSRLAVELEQPEHCPQLMELLKHGRSEVAITAGWALRHLATDEAILAGMLQHVKDWTAKLRSPQDAPGVAEPDLRRMAHLFEAFGLRHYDPAKEVSQSYVAKNPGLGLITRMTAIWACGKLWEHDTNKKLTDELIARIRDKNNMFPESESVRFTSTLALGWIADPSTRAALVECNEEKPAPIFYATEWALNRIEQRQTK